MLAFSDSRSTSSAWPLIAFRHHHMYIRFPFIFHPTQKRTPSVDQRGTPFGWLRQETRCPIPDSPALDRPGNMDTIAIVALHFLKYALAVSPRSMSLIIIQDELLPLSCTGQGHDPSNPSDLARNDVCGDYALTLVDALDSFVVFGDHQGFAEAVQTVIHTVSFDKEVKIQVFEATIRVLGGLLSAHLFAQDPKYGFSPHMPWYDGQLLVLARDLGHRLLPAFTASTTGMPYSRIHLKNGVPKDETSETCAAAAGSLMLEFATLSRLTGEPVFERVARKAMQAVWNRRSSMDLLGNSLSVHTGNWLFPQSSIGAGIDSILCALTKHGRDVAAENISQ